MSPPHPLTPSSLQRQITRLSHRLAALEQRIDQLVLVRLVLFGLGFVISLVLFLSGGGPAAALLALPFWFIPFLVSVYLHRRLDNARQRFTMWRQIKETHLARIALDWEKLPPARFPSPPAGHPFALDLDLQGERSLHRLLDTAVSTAGSRLLLDWLLETAPQEETVLHRQALVQELRPRSLFRDKLHLYAALAAREEGPDAPEKRLLDWLDGPAPSARLRWVLVALIVLGATTAGLLLLEVTGRLSGVWLIPLLLYVALYFTAGQQAAEAFPDMLALRDAFDRLQAVFGFLESYSYTKGSRLERLVAPFLDPQHRPSHYIGRLRRLSAAIGLSQHPLSAQLLNFIFPRTLFYSSRIDALRPQLAADAPGWLAVWHELEALAALGTFHYLHPHYTVPEFVPAGSVPAFTGRSLGHPLIPDTQKVRNDFTLADDGHVVIITGSNMAGKSSFLRTLGVNLCLAYAGGPVDAAQLQTRWFRLFTSIRVTDSVTDGISYFYAEVRRLKALLDALQEPAGRPLFFLIDEIFRGTNNRERLLGSRAYISALVGGHGMGAIATHDLELVTLAEEHQTVANFHFRDAIVDGRMVFDYTLRPGPSPTTNALKIMSLEGLPAPPPRQSTESTPSAADPPESAEGRA